MPGLHHRHGSGGQWRSPPRDYIYEPAGCKACLCFTSNRSVHPTHYACIAISIHALSMLRTTACTRLSYKCELVPPSHWLSDSEVLLSRPTNAVNVYVSNLAASGTIPPGWTFTMYNPAYVSQSGFWNMQVQVACHNLPIFCKAVWMVNSNVDG